MLFAIMSLPLVTVAYTIDMSNEEHNRIEESDKIQEQESQPTEGNTVLAGKYDHLFLKYSTQHGVSYELVRAISLCENTQQDTTLQSSLFYNFSDENLGIIEGERERSFGLVQINLDYNPTITLEQATNPDFSVNLLAEWISQGNASRWGCYTNGGYRKYM